MLRQFGVPVSRAGRTVILTPAPLRATSIRVPGDISSAAFPLVAALVAARAEVTVIGVGVNPTRTGLLDALEAMGAEIDVRPEPLATARAEPAAALAVRACPLRGTKVSGPLIPRLIDEVPVLTVAALTAQGSTEIADAAELRVKESDRIAAIAREFGKMGARISERPDGMLIEGGTRLRGAAVDSGGDHRMAMALAVAALGAEGETVIEDTACVATSFPGFADLLNTLAGGEAVTVLA
jgi:3-phosphoshikimate 1-carboxyvinyltransferase